MQLGAGPLQAIFVLGRYSDGQESVPADLDPFLAWQAALDRPLDWAVCAFGRQETACLAAAAGAGGKLRIGFENSLWNADGALAADNAERVAEITQVVSKRQDPPIGGGLSRIYQASFRLILPCPACAAARRLGQTS